MEQFLSVEVLNANFNHIHPFTVHGYQLFNATSCMKMLEGSFLCQDSLIHKLRQCTSAIG